MLRALRIIGIVRLIEQAAGRGGGVVGQRPARGEKLRVQNARLPVLFVGVRIDRQAAGKDLIEVAARNDVIALRVFVLNESAQLLCLGDLALAGVVCFQMEVYQHKLLVAALDREIACEQAALEICDPHRPGEGAGEGDTVGLVNRETLRHGEQAAVYLADGRPGNGHKGTGVVERVGLAAHALVEIAALVQPVGAGGIGIHFLQDDKVGGLLGNGAADAVQISERDVSVLRL